MLRKPCSRAISLIGMYGTSSVSGIGKGLPCRASWNGSKSSTGLGKSALSAASAAGLTGVDAARWTVPSRRRKTAAANPPSRRLALVAIASNTGVVSDGELAITFRISAVAVCRSSASLRLVEQPHIFDGDDGLVGKGLKQLNVMIGERPRFLARELIMPIGRPVADQGRDGDAAKAARPSEHS